MPSQRQIEANRRNAQKSTGPTSVTGKARSSMNALKTGIHAKSLVLPSETVGELEELIEDCYTRFHPTTPEARCYLDDLTVRTPCRTLANHLNPNQFARNRLRSANPSPNPRRNALSATGTGPPREQQAVIVSPRFS